MEFYSKSLILIAICAKLVCCAYNCSTSNEYPNKAYLLNILNGYLYIAYNTVAYHDCEVFNLQPGLSAVNGHTTFTGADCCIDIDIFRKLEEGNYFRYNITTQPNCPAQFDETAIIKLMNYKMTAMDYCFIVWTCRHGREGVERLCSKAKISPDLDTWVQSEYNKYNLTALPNANNCELESCLNGFRSILP